MKIYNPTKNAIEVKIFGDNYRIEAEGTLTRIPQEVANYWRGLHEFLRITDDEVVVTEKEEATPAAEQTASEVVAVKETPVEAPKAKTKASANKAK